MAYASGLINVDAKDSVFADFPFDVPNLKPFRARHALGCFANSLEFHFRAIRETCALPQKAIHRLANRLRIDAGQVGTRRKLSRPTKKWARAHSALRHSKSEPKYKPAWAVRASCAGMGTDR